MYINSKTFGSTMSFFHSRSFTFLPFILPSSDIKFLIIYILKWLQLLLLLGSRTMTFFAIGRTFGLQRVVQKSNRFVTSNRNAIQATVLQLLRANWIIEIVTDFIWCGYYGFLLLLSRIFLYLLWMKVLHFFLDIVDL